MRSGLRPASGVSRGAVRLLLAGGALVGALVMAGSPAPAAAQDPSCEFLEGTVGLNAITLAGGARITYLSRPRIGCPDGVRIRADSAISYSAQDMTHLLGNVFFRDGTQELRSQEARYFPSTGRLQASGDVRLEDLEDGSVIENGDLVLLRANDFREQDELTVTTGVDRVRPRATLYIRPQPDTASGPAAAPDTVVAAPEEAPEDTTAVQQDTPAGVPDTTAAPGDPSAMAPDTTPPSPYLVEADRLHLVGQDYFEALGNTVIDRDSLHATSHRAVYDGEGGRLRLDGTARLEGAAYDLEGEEILMDMTSGEIREVTARRRGLLTGEDIRLDAPVIHLFLVQGLLDRLVAVPVEASRVDSLPEPDSVLLAQPVATADQFVLRADSLDVRAPRQELERIHAVGSARGRSTARDSLNVESLPEVARSDWLEGDTIVATFRPEMADPGATDAGDSGAQGEDYVLEELVASGSARSLYRMLPSDSTSRPGVDPPAVHYVTGSRILIAMEEGQVRRMEVDGPSRGYHLEPAGRRAASDSVPADSLPSGPVADTVPPPPDTVGGGGQAARTPSAGEGGPGGGAPADGGRAPALRGEPRAEPGTGRGGP